jgi:HK97 family phage major capsid protein
VNVLHGCADVTVSGDALQGEGIGRPGQLGQPGVPQGMQSGAIRQLQEFARPSQLIFQCPARERLRPVVEVEFYNYCTQALAQIDEIFDPGVARIIDGKNNRPLAFPLSSDIGNPATVVSENAPIPTVDPTIGGINLNRLPMYKTALFASVELLRDSGIDIGQFLADCFILRFECGAGPTVISTLLAGSAQGAVATGSSANDGGTGTAQNSIGSDDIGALIESLDPAYASSPRCFLAMNWHVLTRLLRLKTKQGALVFPHPRNPDSGRFEIMGRPVAICPSLPNSSASSKPVVFGDFSRLLIRRGPMAMAVSAEVPSAIERGILHYRGTWGIQSAVLVDTTVSPADLPFVYLRQAS